MLIHYLDYIRLLNKDLKRKGVYLFDIDKYELDNQVAVLEEFFYLNNLFKQSGGTSYIQSQYKYDAMSYLRDKISAEYSDTWNKEFEELTKQPENAGKIDCDIERIDDFINKLGLKIRETVRPNKDEYTIFSQNNSAQATQYNFSYSSTPLSFEGDEDEEDEDIDEDELSTGLEEEFGDESEDVDEDDFGITQLDFEENIPLEDLFPSGGIISEEDEELDEYLGTDDEDDFEENDLDTFDEDELDDLDTEDEVSLDVDYEDADILDYSDIENDEIDDEDEDLDMSIQDDNPYGDYDDDEEEIDLDTENYDEDLEEYDEIEDDYSEEDDEELDLSADLEDDESFDEDEDEEEFDLGMDDDFTDPDDDYSEEDDDDYSISDYMYSDEPTKHSDVKEQKIPTKKQNVQRSNEKHADTLCKLVNKGVRFGSRKLNSKINGGN